MTLDDRLRALEQSGADPALMRGLRKMTNYMMTNDAVGDARCPFCGNPGVRAKHYGSLRMPKPWRAECSKTRCLAMGGFHSTENEATAAFCSPAAARAELDAERSKLRLALDLLRHIASCGRGLNRECDRCGTLNSDLNRIDAALKEKA